ncbi:aspartate 1-decarboxylase [Streptomyces sp. NPDC059452]|uniref:aspartate 1-decarboxylase n=1 Tax=Streptomyces sp. NPDC059452 TaxID=3346835 RepID=UPI0036ADE281
MIQGPCDSSVIGINGAAVWLISPGDLVIIIAYAQVTQDEARELKPRVVFVDEHNRVVLAGDDPAEVTKGSGLIRGDLPAPSA